MSIYKYFESNSKIKLRRFIIRFRNEDDLNIFSKNIGIKLNKNIHAVNLVTKIKKKKKKKTLDTVKTEYWWKESFKQMPEFIQENVEAYATITVFIDDSKVNEFKDIINQDIYDTTLSIWYPKYIPVKGNKYLIGGEKTTTPIYVISKGRYDIKMTSYWLSIMEQQHYIVVEPQEVDKYNKTLGKSKFCTVLELDMDYKLNYDACDDLGNSMSKGSGGARNFCWDHSMKNGYKWHWLLDDNIDGFYYLNKNKQIKVRTSSIFKIIEDFVNRFDNIGIAGMQYQMFCAQTSRVAPYATNNRIFSCILINNSIPHQWKGRFNEDVILSINTLKEGYSTLLYHQFLCDKIATQKVKGGNTEELYGDGTHQKSQMLVDMFPEIARHAYRFNRDHHYVDYSKFKNNKMPLKEEFKNLEDGIDNKGIYIVQLDEEESRLSRSNLEAKYPKANISYEEIYNNDYYSEKKREVSKSLVSKYF